MFVEDARLLDKGVRGLREESLSNRLSKLQLLSFDGLSKILSQTVVRVLGGDTGSVDMTSGGGVVAGSVGVRSRGGLEAGVAEVELLPRSESVQSDWRN
jgi:hypothetical protein